MTDNKFQKKSFLQVNFVKVSFYLFVLSISLFTIYSFLPLFQGVLAAYIIAYLINPVVDYYERQQVARIWIVAIVFIILILLLLLLIYGVKSFLPTQEEITEFQNKTISNLIIVKDNLKRQYPIISWDDINASLIDNIKSSFNVTNAIPKIWSNISDIISMIIVIPFAVFFFLLNERQIKKWLLSFIPNKYFEVTLITFREVDTIFGSYIRGTLLESFIIGLLTSIGWYICGFQFSTAFIAGGIVGLANAIPYVGPLFGAILGVGLYILNLVPSESVSMFGISPTVFNILLVVVIVQILDQFIKPVIIGKSVNLHPLIVILGIMAGSNLFGFVGMLVAIPVIAIIKVVISTLYKQLKGFDLLSENVVSVVTQYSNNPAHDSLKDAS